MPRVLSLSELKQSLGSEMPPDMTPEQLEAVRKGWEASAFVRGKPSPVLSLSEMKREIDPPSDMQVQRWGVVEQFGKGYGEDFTGDVLRTTKAVAAGDALRRMADPEWKGLEAHYARVPQPKGIAEEAAYALGHLASRMPLYVGAGKLMASMPGMAQLAKKKVVGPLLARGAQMTGMFAGADVAAEATRQATRPEVPFSGGELGRAAGHGVATGVALTPATMVRGPLMRYGAEVLALTGVGAALERRLPEKKDLAINALIIGMLKVGGALPGRGQPREGRFIDPGDMSRAEQVRDVWRKMVAGWRQRGDIESIRNAFARDPEAVEVHVKALEGALKGARGLDPIFRDFFDPEVGKAHRDAMQLLEQAQRAGDQAGVKEAQRLVDAIEHDVLRRIEDFRADVRETLEKGRREGRIEPEPVAPARGLSEIRAEIEALEQRLTAPQPSMEATRGIEGRLRQLRQEALRAQQGEAEPAPPRPAPAREPEGARGRQPVSPDDFAQRLEAIDAQIRQGNLEPGEIAALEAEARQIAERMREFGGGPAAVEPGRTQAEPRMDDVHGPAGIIVPGATLPQAAPGRAERPGRVLFGPDGEPIPSETIADAAADAQTARHARNLSEAAQSALDVMTGPEGRVAQAADAARDIFGSRVTATQIADFKTALNWAMRVKQAPRGQGVEGGSGRAAARGVARRLGWSPTQIRQLASRQLAAIIEGRLRPADLPKLVARLEGEARQAKLTKATKGERQRRLEAQIKELEAEREGADPKRQQAIDAELKYLRDELGDELVRGAKRGPSKPSPERPVPTAKPSEEPPEEPPPPPPAPPSGPSPAPSGGGGGAAAAARAALAPREPKPTGPPRVAPGSKRRPPKPKAEAEPEPEKPAPPKKGKSPPKKGKPSKARGPWRITRDGESFEVDEQPGDKVVVAVRSGYGEEEASGKATMYVYPDEMFEPGGDIYKATVNPGPKNDYAKVGTTIEVDGRPHVAFGGMYHGDMRVKGAWEVVPRSEYKGKPKTYSELVKSWDAQEGTRGSRIGQLIKIRGKDHVVVAGPRPLWNYELGPDGSLPVSSRTFSGKTRAGRAKPAKPTGKGGLRPTATTAAAEQAERDLAESTAKLREARERARKKQGQPPIGKGKNLYAVALSKDGQSISVKAITGNRRDDLRTRINIYKQGPYTKVAGVMADSEAQARGKAAGAWKVEAKVPRDEVRTVAKAGDRVVTTEQMAKNTNIPVGTKGTVTKVVKTDSGHAVYSVTPEGSKTGVRMGEGDFTVEAATKPEGKPLPTGMTRESVERKIAQQEQWLKETQEAKPGPTTAWKVRRHRQELAHLRSYLKRLPPEEPTPEKPKPPTAPAKPPAPVAAKPEPEAPKEKPKPKTVKQAEAAAKRAEKKAAELDETHEAKRKAVQDKYLPRIKELEDQLFAARAEHMRVKPEEYEIRDYDWNVIEAIEPKAKGFSAKRERIKKNQRDIEKKLRRTKRGTQKNAEYENQRAAYHDMMVDLERSMRVIVWDLLRAGKAETISELRRVVRPIHGRYIGAHVMLARGLPRGEADKWAKEVERLYDKNRKEVEALEREGREAKQAVANAQAEIQKIKIEAQKQAAEKERAQLRTKLEKIVESAKRDPKMTVYVSVQKEVLQLAEENLLLVLTGKMPIAFAGIPGKQLATDLGKLRQAGLLELRKGKGETQADYYVTEKLAPELYWRYRVHHDAKKAVPIWSEGVSKQADFSMPAAGEAQTYEFVGREGQILTTTVKGREFFTQGDYIIEPPPKPKAPKPVKGKKAKKAPPDKTPFKDKTVMNAKDYEKEFDTKVQTVDLVKFLSDKIYWNPGAKLRPIAAQTEVGVYKDSLIFLHGEADQIAKYGGPEVIAVKTGWFNLIEQSWPKGEWRYTLKKEGAPAGWQGGQPILYMQGDKLRAVVMPFNQPIETFKALWPVVEESLEFQRKIGKGRDSMESPETPGSLGAASRYDMTMKNVRDARFNLKEAKRLGIDILKAPDGPPRKISAKERKAIEARIRTANKLLGPRSTKAMRAWLKESIEIRKQPKPDQKAKPGKHPFEQTRVEVPKEGLDLSDGERAVLMQENLNFDENAARLLGQPKISGEDFANLTRGQKVVHLSRRVFDSRHPNHIDNILKSEKYKVWEMPSEDVENVMISVAKRFAKSRVRLPAEVQEAVKQIDGPELPGVASGEPGAKGKTEWVNALFPARSVLRKAGILEDVKTGLRGAYEGFKTEWNFFMSKGERMIFRGEEKAIRPFKKGDYRNRKKIKKGSLDDAIIHNLWNNPEGDPRYVRRPFVTMVTDGPGWKAGDQIVPKAHHREAAAMLVEADAAFADQMDMPQSARIKHHAPHVVKDVLDRVLDHSPANPKLIETLHGVMAKSLGVNYSKRIVAKWLPEDLARGKALQIMDYMLSKRPNTLPTTRRAIETILGADENVEMMLPTRIRHPYQKKRTGAPYVESAMASFEIYLRYTLRKVHLEPTIRDLKPLVEGMGESKSAGIMVTKRRYTEQLVAHTLGQPHAMDVSVDAMLEHINIKTGGKLMKIPVLKHLFRPRALSRAGAMANRYQYYRLLAVALDSSMTNLSQAVNTAARFGGIGAAEGYANLLNPFFWAKLRKAHLMQEFQGFFTGPQPIWKQPLGKFEKVVLSPFRLAEAINRGAAYAAGLAEAKRMGLSNEKAVRMGMGKVNDFVKKAFPEHFKDTYYTSEAEWHAKAGVIETQFGYSAVESAPIFSHPIGRPFLQFWNFPTQQTSFIYDGIRGRVSPGVYGRLRFLALLGWSTFIADQISRRVFGVDVRNLWSIRGIIPHGPGPNILLGWYIAGAMAGDWAAKAKLQQEYGKGGYIIPRAVRKAAGITHKHLPKDSPYRYLPVRPVEEETARGRTTRPSRSGRSNRSSR